MTHKISKDFDFDTVIDRRGGDSLKWNKYAGRDPEFQIDIALNYAERGAPQLLNKLEKDVDARANVLRDRLEGLRPEVQAAIDAIKSGVY